MKLIKPSFEIIEQQPGLEGVYKQIEQAGRTCYRSEDKITEDSAKSFVDNVLMKRGHLSPLEHGTVYLKIPTGLMAEVNQTYHKYLFNPYSKAICRYVPLDGYIYVTTNYRVLVENRWLDDLQYICEPTEFHEKRITVHFVCDRGILAEFTRHRVFSFSAESTRYCNYSLDKFDNEVTFIRPLWLEGNSDYSPSAHRAYDYLYNETYLEENIADEDRFIFGLVATEDIYLKLISQGRKPQEARAILPSSLKTELVMTGFVDDWWGEYLVIDKSTGLIDQRIHGKFYDELNNIDRGKYRIVEKGFFPLRCSSGAHPQAQELAIPLRQEFINKKIW